MLLAEYLQHRAPNGVNTPGRVAGWLRGNLSRAYSRQAHKLRIWRDNEFYISHELLKSTSGSE
jgi:hypothetical protein